MILERKATWICHCIFNGILGIDGALSKKILTTDFCCFFVSIQRPGFFSLGLRWDCSDDFFFYDYGWFFNIFHRPFFSSLLFCVIRCGTWSLFWLWLPFNIYLQSLQCEKDWAGKNSTGPRSFETRDVYPWI